MGCNPPGMGPGGTRKTALFTLGAGAMLGGAPEMKEATSFGVYTISV